MTAKQSGPRPCDDLATVRAAGFPVLSPVERRVRALFRVQAATDHLVRRLVSGYGLSVEVATESYTVSGGAEAHTVSRDATRCDCRDHRERRGAICKHIVAVRLYRLDYSVSILADMRGREAGGRGTEERARERASRTGCDTGEEVLG